MTPFETPSLMLTFTFRAFSTCFYPKQPLPKALSFLWKFNPFFRIVPRCSKAHPHRAHVVNRLTTEKKNNLVLVCLIHSAAYRTLLSLLRHVQTRPCELGLKPHQGAGDPRRIMPLSVRGIISRRLKVKFKDRMRKRIDGRRLGRDSLTPRADFVTRQGWGSASGLYGEEHQERAKTAGVFC